MKTTPCSALPLALFTASMGSLLLAAPGDAGAAQPRTASTEARIAAPRGENAARAKPAPTGAASIGAISAAPGNAGTARTKAITASDVMYSTEEKLGFSIEAYLAQRAPYLSRQAESISHWAGYTGISPKVLIALMEQESGIVGRRRMDLETALRPFGQLSPKTGFNHQLRDVAQRLKAIVLSQREQALSGKAGVVPADPIELLYAQSGQGKSAAATAGRLQFANTYARLFNETWGSTTKPDILNRVVAKAIPSTTLLRLPYATNESWKTSGGPHSDNGSGTIMSSIDFQPIATSTKKVRASANGTVKRHSSCYVEIIHSNGWSTHYYHLDGIRFADKATVYTGDWISGLAATEGQALCSHGGSWSGEHVHWTLTKDGTENSLNGVTISGYKITATSTTNYSTDCNKNYLIKGTGDWCFGETLKNTL